MQKSHGAQLWKILSVYACLCVVPSRLAIIVIIIIIHDGQDSFYQKYRVTAEIGRDVLYRRIWLNKDM